MSGLFRFLDTPKRRLIVDHAVDTVLVLVCEIGIDLLVKWAEPIIGAGYADNIQTVLKFGLFATVFLFVVEFFLLCAADGYHSFMRHARDARGSESSQLANKKDI